MSSASSLRMDTSTFFMDKVADQHPDVNAASA
jgi:hypothetical protein